MLNVTLFSFQSAHLSHRSYFGIADCSLFCVLLYFYCLFILKWSIRRRSLSCFSVVRFFFSLLSSCFEAIVSLYPAKLDVFHNAKLLFYVSCFLFHDINWMPFERVEWQQFNLPFSSWENFLPCSALGLNVEAEGGESFLVRDVNAEIVVEAKENCWHICHWGRKLGVGDISINNNAFISGLFCLKSLSFVICMKLRRCCSST